MPDIVKTVGKLIAGIICIATFALFLEIDQRIGWTLGGFIFVGCLFLKLRRRS